MSVVTVGCSLRLRVYRVGASWSASLARADRCNGAQACHIKQSTMAAPNRPAAGVCVSAALRRGTGHSSGHAAVSRTLGLTVWFQRSKVAHAVANVMSEQCSALQRCGILQDCKIQSLQRLTVLSNTVPLLQTAEDPRRLHRRTQDQGSGTRNPVNYRYCFF
jgi:hypothetical protein